MRMICAVAILVFSLGIIMPINSAVASLGTAANEAISQATSTNAPLSENVSTLMVEHDRGFFTTLMELGKRDPTSYAVAQRGPASPSTGTGPPPPPPAPMPPTH